MRNLNSNCSTSFDSEDTILNASLNGSNTALYIENKEDLSAVEKDNLPVDDIESVFYDENFDEAEMRPNCNENRSNSNRLSSVLENVKRFEAQSDSSGSPTSTLENEVSLTRPFANTKPYIQV